MADICCPDCGTVLLPAGTSIRRAEVRCPACRKLWAVSIGIKGIHVQPAEA